MAEARKQARQRILQGQAFPNEEKILSLYEPEGQVIVRKKAGADVEFGNTLFRAGKASTLTPGKTLRQFSGWIRSLTHY